MGLVNKWEFMGKDATSKDWVSLYGKFTYNPS